MWVQARTTSQGSSADPFGDITYLDLATRTIHKITDDEFYDDIPSVSNTGGLMVFASIRTNYSKIRGLGSPSSLVLYSWIEDRFRLLDPLLVPASLIVTSEASFDQAAIRVTPDDTVLYYEASFDYESMFLKYSFHNRKAVVLDSTAPLILNIITSQNSDHIALNTSSGGFRQNNLKYWSMIINDRTRDTIKFKNDSLHFKLISFTADSALVRITPIDEYSASLNAGYYWLQTSSGKALGKLTLPHTTCGEGIVWISDRHRIYYAGDPVSGKCGEVYDIYEYDMETAQSITLTNTGICDGGIQVFLP